MTERMTRERALEELTAAVAGARPQLIDEWEAAALIESFGYTDARIRREFGFPDTAAIGAHVFHALEKPSCDWVETALRCGYYDQAHLIRDCKSLSGSTPAVLQAKGADLARHFYQHVTTSHSSNTVRHPGL